jgi:hypothetical protein
MSDHVLLQMPPDERRLSPLEIENLASGKQPSWIVKLTVDVPSSHQPQAVDTTSRWKTLEFLFYYVTFVVVVPIMVWIPVVLSSRESIMYFVVIQF